MLVILDEKRLIGGIYLSLDLSQMVIDHIIIHEIKRQKLNEDKEPPIYSEIESRLDDEIKKYIKEKIITTIDGTRSYEVVFKKDSKSPVPKCVKKLLIEGKLNLVTLSKTIADHLNDLQSARSPGGLVTVIMGNIKEKVFVGVLKLEKEEGARLKQTKIKGLSTYDMVHFKDLILTEKTKLFKIGLFHSNSFGVTKFDGSVCDNQLSNSPYKEIADFFLNFLGCELIGDPKKQTKEFFIASQEFFEKKVTNPVLKADYNIHLLSYITSNRKTIQPRTFAHANLNVNHKQPYINDLTEKGVRIREIQKDTSLIESKIKRIRMEFKSGVKITASQDVFEKHVNLKKQEDGKTKAEIIDNVKKVGS